MLIDLSIHRFILRGRQRRFVASSSMALRHFAVVDLRAVVKKVRHSGALRLLKIGSSMKFSRLRTDTHTDMRTAVCTDAHIL